MSDLIDDALFQPDYGTAREAFVAFRKKRDETLAMPKLILPAIHLRARAGKLLERESNARSKLKLPLDALGRKA